MMQCEKEVLKRIDELIAAIHHAAKIKSQNVASVTVRRP